MVTIGKSKNLKNPIIVSAFLCAIIIYSFSSQIYEKNSFQSVIPNEKIEMVWGKVISSPAKLSNGMYYSVKIKSTYAKSNDMESSTKGNFTAYIPSEIVESLYPGKLFSLTSSDKFIESGINLCLIGKFSKGGKFYSDDVKNFGFKTDFFSKLSEVRGVVRLQFKRLMYSWKNAGGLLLSLLSGSREYMEDSIATSFKMAGLSHILALSGMHLAMVSGIGFFLGDKTGRRKIALFSQFFAVSLFVWFAGFSPSLFRAFLCVCISLFNIILSVPKENSLSNLCLAFILQSIICPNDVTNIAFILSYGALLGILIFSDFFNQLISCVLPKKIASSLSSSIGAQIVTTPVSLHFFGFFSPIGIISSLFVSPLVVFFIYAGLVLILICLIFPSLSSYSGIFMQFIYNVISLVVSFFSNFPAIQT